MLAKGHTMQHVGTNGASPSAKKSGNLSSDYEKLRALILNRSLIKKDGEDFELASGKKSRFFFDMKMTSYDPEGCNLIGREILQRLEGVEVDYIGGLESGAISVVVAVTTVSFKKGNPIPSFFIRKTPKEHGTRKYIEGNLEDCSNVVLVEDVTTTGNSVLKAVDAVREHNCKVDTVITVVDREEGAEANLANHGIKLVALFSKGDFEL
jgi:orotate phosphoribosyltransferase